MAEQTEQSFLDHLKGFFVKETVAPTQVQTQPVQPQMPTETVTLGGEATPGTSPEIEALRAEVEALKSRPPIQVIAGGMPPTAGMTPQYTKDSIKGLSREQFTENRNAILDAARNKTLGG